jgi:hypothetical protein
MELSMSTTKGGAMRITGESLHYLLKLPKDAKILKIVSSRDMTYCFDVIFFSDEGFEIGEGSSFPLVRTGDFSREE